MARLAIVLVLLLAGACKNPANPAPPSVPPPPRLTVLVAIGQLRAAELVDYGSLWRHGFPRLLQEGRDYAPAFLDYGYVDPAAGHAILATGLTPRLHGVVGGLMADPIEELFPDVLIAHGDATNE